MHMHICIYMYAYIIYNLIYIYILYTHVIEYVSVILFNVCNSLYHKSSIVRIPTAGLTTLGPGFQCLPLDLAFLPRCNEIASDGPLCLVTRAVYNGDTWDLSFLEPFFPKSAGK